MSFNESTESSTDSLEKESMSTLLDSCPRGMEKVRPTPGGKTGKGPEDEGGIPKMMLVLTLLPDYHFTASA